MEIMTAHTSEITRPVLTDALFDSWLQYAAIEANCKPQTIKTYNSAIRLFASFCRSNGIQKPDRTTVVAYKAQLMQQHKAESTINLHLAAIRQFFRWAADTGIYDEAIADHVKGAKISSNGHKRDCLTSAQAADLLAVPERDTYKGKRDYAILATMLACGLRDCEISRATRADLRRCGDNTVLYVYGKGHNSADDFVIIPAPVERSIRSYLGARAIIEGNPIAPDAPLFAAVGNRNEGGRMTVQSISRIVKTALRAAGMEDNRLTAHSLRHTAVTLAYLAGQDIVEVQQFARHKNITTTQIYVHELDKSRNNCSRAVAEKLFA